MTFPFWLTFSFLALTSVQAASQAPGQPPGVTAAASKTATIRGKTIDAKTGSPLQAVQVTTRPMGRGEAAGSASSDATGSYEIRVAPGLYSVSASKDGFLLMQYLDVANVPGLQLGDGEEADVDFRMIPGATIAGTVTDARGAPIPGANVQATMQVYRQGKVESQLRSTASTNEQGEYRLTDLPAGRYYLQAGMRGTAAPGIRTFAPVIYPRASRMEDGEAIRVEEGEGRGIVDFELPDASTYSVSGRITFLATGQPVANMAISVDPDFLGFETRARTQSGNDGTFRIEGLTAGGYRMEGRLVGDHHGQPGGHFLRFFELPAADITDMFIQIGLGTMVEGQLRGVGATLPEKMSVQLDFRNPLGGTGYVSTATSAPDGGFQITAQPGTYDLNVGNDPAGAGTAPEFFVSAVIVDGQDASDSGITVGDTPLNASVTVDLRPGTVTGKILDFDDTPIPGAQVVLMSVDPGKRLLRRYWREIKSDREGTFRLSSLVPGEYLLMTWPGYRPWAGLDPEVFSILEEHAVHVTVDRGTVVMRNVRLTEEIREQLRTLSP
jgi:hypothetical protein